MKLYDQNEIAAILKKAAETSRSDSEDRVTGLSIDELKELAAEAGIDPLQVVRAAKEIAQDSETRERRFWGGPFSFSRQVLVDREISVGQWEEMLVVIRDFFRSGGDLTTRDSVWEWSSPRGTTNSAQVTAVKSHGKTRVSVGWNGPLTALPFYLPVPLIAILSVFFASEFLELTAVPGVAFSLVATGLAFLAGRWALGRTMDKGFKKLREFVADLDLIASGEPALSDTTPERTMDPPIPDESQESIFQLDNQNEVVPLSGSGKDRIRNA